MSFAISRPTALFSITLGIALSAPFAVKYTASLALTSPVAAAEQGVNIDVLLRRAGLSPSVLAAAGVASNQVAGVVSAATTYLGEHPSTLSSADAAYSEARVTHDALERKIGSGLASQQELAQFATAKSALASATTARSSALTALFNASIAGLDQTQREKLATLRANADQKAPIEFRAVSRTEAEWLSLRNALSNERVSAACGEQPHGGCQTLLSNARANEAVAAAKTACDSNLATIQSAWSSACGG